MTGVQTCALPICQVAHLDERVERLVEQEATSAQVSARGESVDVDYVELREVASELATFMVTGGIPTPRLTELREQVAAADGLIVVTPVFNGSYSGLFKMFFDALDKDSLAGTPVLIAATAGSARHSLVLDHARDGGQLGRASCRERV